MTTRRKRKHQRLEVCGALPLDERIPRWEAELLLAALARLPSPRPSTDEEATDVARR